MRSGSKPLARGSVGPALATACAALSLAGAPGAAAQTDGLAPDQVLSVQGAFEGKKGKPAKDLSGIACLPPGPGGARECLVVNDESQVAQRAMLSGRTLAPGALWA